MKILKKIFGILIVPYIIIALFVTACLVRYNDYGITVFGDYSFIIVEDDELEPDFKENDLVIVRKNDSSEASAGDMIFFYDTYAKQMEVAYGKIIGKEDLADSDETTYTLEGNKPLSSEYFIGLGKTSKVYSGMGGILSFLESRFGYLLIFILPILIMFLYEIYAIVMEIKNSKEDE